jgi:hypothetical protein
MLSGRVWLLASFALSCGIAFGADQRTAFDNEDVIQMVRWKVADVELVASICRNARTDFDLTSATITILRNEAVSGMS